MSCKRAAISGSLASQLTKYKYVYLSASKHTVVLNLFGMHVYHIQQKWQSRLTIQRAVCLTGDVITHVEKCRKRKKRTSYEQEITWLLFTQISKSVSW